MRVVTSSQERHPILFGYVSPAFDLRARVLLLIPHLGIGGAQHVVSTLARHLNVNKYEVHLALITQSDSTCPKFPPSVTLHCLGAERARYAAFRLLRLIWRLRPAVIFIGMAHLAPPLLLLRRFLPAGTRVVTRQNGSLSATLADLTPHPIFRPLLAAAYRGADGIICQSNAAARELKEKLQLSDARITVLPNPVDIPEIRVASPRAGQQTPSNPYLLAVGRLVPEKGFDLLLEAFACLRNDFPPLRLRIAGCGFSRQDLETQSEALAIENRVEFLGNVNSPSQYFHHASAFVLSSREDELPNALLEAAAAGLPIIATPSSAGLTELLQDRPGIWLARAATAHALECALRNALGAIHTQQRFAHEWIQSFGLQSAMPAYEALIDRTINESSTSCTSQS